MADTYTLKGLFKAIADSIRNRTGDTDSIPATEFAEKILTIDEGLFVKVATGEITSIQASDIDGVTAIGYYAFAGCSKLESVTLPSSITSIPSNAFTDCTNLKTINVPWAEGAISNAPWGATNATITYNYGGE